MLYLSTFTTQVTLCNVQQWLDLYIACVPYQYEKNDCGGLHPKTQQWVTVHITQWLHIIWHHWNNRSSEKVELWAITKTKLTLITWVNDPFTPRSKSLAEQHGKDDYSWLTCSCVWIRLELYYVFRQPEFYWKH